MRYVIADTCEGMDESFHLVEHAIDDHCELGEGIVGRPMRKPFVQIAGDDQLDPLFDLRDALMGTEAQQRTRREAKRNDGYQAESERPADDARNARDFIDIPPDD
jgi:hypothetical protein